MPRLHVGDQDQSPLSPLKLKSPLNLKRVRSYKVRYIALSILRTKTTKKKLNE